MQNKRYISKLSVVFLSIYYFLVLYFTVINRPVGVYSSELSLFWSYRKWFAGNWELGKEILFNIAMFVPIGFFLGTLLAERKHGFILAIAISLLMSAMIEMLQLYFLRGLCELDDLFSNTLGAILGFFLYIGISLVFSQPIGKYLVIAFEAICVIVCLVVCLRMETPVDSSVLAYCFQVDTIENEDGNLTLSGFSFIYDKDTPVEKLSLTLENTQTGNKKKLVCETGLFRRDVNDYFLCSHDYSRAGFLATESDISEDDEFEILVNLRGWFDLHTGVYLRGENYYCSSNIIGPDVAGTDLEPIVEKGYLRVYRPDYHCFVYQYDGNLHWIVDENFNFKDSGKTYIQYQLWTTQIENLPKHRLDHEWYWDNIGFYFEDNEITDKIDCGKYRVSRRKLPTEYPITAIVTGYYENGKWIWQNYFRPYYIFGVEFPIFKTSFDFKPSRMPTENTIAARDFNYSN